MHDNAIEIDVDVINETDNAYQVTYGVIDKQTGAELSVWIPKSQVSDYTEGKHGIESIFIPEWLAIKRGMV